MARVRNWCFTLNNYTDAEHGSIRQALGGGSITYAICGVEVGESGTPHLQGFVQFGKPMRPGGVKQFFGTNRVHIEAAKGTAVQNRTYCSKEGNFTEYGQLTERGCRSDLKLAKDLLDRGEDLRGVASGSFETFVKYHRGLSLYQSVMRLGRRKFRTQVVWFYGATGTGKSRTAHAEAEYFSNGQYCSIGDTSLQWFDPYRDDKVVVFDDFTGAAKIDVLLRVWDRYPLQVPIKGGFVEWKPRIVYVTSNASPWTLYGDDRQWGPLCRRIDLVVRYDADGTQTEWTGLKYAEEVA